MLNKNHGNLNKLKLSTYLYKFKRDLINLVRKVILRIILRDCFGTPASGNEKYAVGWVVASHLKRPIMSFSILDGAVGMRVSKIAEWINLNISDCHCEMYRPEKRYDAVIFFKAMEAIDQTEAKKVKAYGGKVLFDANVNYYEIDGEFGSFSNRPTLKQQQDAIAMTALADLCIADSTAILERIKSYNNKAICIPDNVNLDVFKFNRIHRPVNPVRLVWSGISFKADHLLFLKDVLADIDNVELVLVAERKPSVIRPLANSIKCRYFPYTDEGYAMILRQCDIIISPKMLVNSYEIGHTEYKITLGMAIGLPAVASPQQSYIEAISYKGGGFIADTTEDWKNALELLVRDHNRRAEIGRKAKETILECYATTFIADRYHREIRRCLEV